MTREFLDVSGVPLEYFTYLPDTADPHNMPLVLAFHGGGNNAEYLMFSTGWPDLAKEHGFMVVSVNQHVERSAADIIALLDHLQVKYPGIDPTRVYSTGFSMGSVKTWNLNEMFTERFAAIAPMSGSFAPATAEVPEAPMPTIYFAGLDSLLPELPSPECTFTGCGPRTPNDIDARLGALFEQNNVVDDYTFDVTADSTWGIAPTSTFTIQDDLFRTVSVEVDQFASTDGRVITALAGVSGIGHETVPVEAQVAWQFLSQFSRNADGTVNVTVR